MKRADMVSMNIEWSEEDGCYVGRCPDLMLGGVHGMDLEEVQHELCAVVEEWRVLFEQDNGGSYGEATLYVH